MSKRKSRKPRKPRVRLDIPKFVIKPDKRCDPKWLAAITKAVADFKKELYAGKHPRTVAYLQQVTVLYRSRGNYYSWHEAKRKGWDRTAMQVQDEHQRDRFIIRLGKLLPQELVDKYAGVSCFDVTIRDSVRTNIIRIDCWTLLSTKTKWGKRFYSGLKIPINRIPMRLLFSNHARERLVQRCKAITRDNGQMLLTAGSMMLANWDKQQIKYSQALIENEISLAVYSLSGEPLPGHHGLAFWKLFYLPCYIKKNVADIPTIIIPGMWQTPEHQAVKSLPRHVRPDFIEMLGTEGLNCSLMAWLWFSGAPMVVDKDMQPIKPPACDLGPEEKLDVALQYDSLEKCVKALGNL